MATRAMWACAADTISRRNFVLNPESLSHVIENEANYAGVVISFQPNTKSSS